MWCDMTNSRIDMMRVPYTDQIESQVYSDSAENTPDISSAITAENMADGNGETIQLPEKFTVIEYKINATDICATYASSDCTKIENAIKWLTPKN